MAGAFRADPCVTYILSSVDADRLDATRERMFQAFFTAATLNDATIEEADDWQSCGVFLPPGKKVANPWTLIPAGLIPLLFKIGLGGCTVRDYLLGRPARKPKVAADFTISS